MGNIDYTSCVLITPLKTLFNFSRNPGESHYPHPIIHFRLSRPQVIFPNQFRISAMTVWLSGSHGHTFPVGTTPWRLGRVERRRTDEQWGSHDTSLKWSTWLISLPPLWTSLPFSFHLPFASHLDVPSLTYPPPPPFSSLFVPCPLCYMICYIKQNISL